MEISRLTKLRTTPLPLAQACSCVTINRSLRLVLQEWMTGLRSRPLNRAELRSLLAEEPQRPPTIFPSHWRFLLIYLRALVGAVCAVYRLTVPRWAETATALTAEQKRKIRYFRLPLIGVANPEEQGQRLTFRVQLGTQRAIACFVDRGLMGPTSFHLVRLRPGRTRQSTAVKRENNRRAQQRWRDRHRPKSREARREDASAAGTNRPPQQLKFEFLLSG